MGIRQTFNDFQPLTRILLIASLIVGTLLLAGFTLTDAGVDLKLWSWDPKPAWLKRYNADWLHSHSYIPNILAAITGFLIGAPIALVVLAAFTVQREERAALDRVNKISAFAWQKFRDSALVFANDERIYTGLRHTARSLQNIHDRVFNEYQRRISSAQEYDSDSSQHRGITDLELDDFQDFLRKMASVMETYMTQATEYIGYNHELQIQWSILRTNWNTLSQYVRLQRLERNLDWFHEQLDAIISDHLVDSQHPVSGFVKIHESASSDSRVLSMYKAFETIQRDGQSSADDLRQKIMAGYTGGGSQPVNVERQREYGWKTVEGHAIASEFGHAALWSLKKAVEDVDRSGWPANAVRPMTTE